MLMFGQFFTLEGVRYFTSKESLEEEANNMILEDKNEFLSIEFVLLASFLGLSFDVK